MAGTPIRQDYLKDVIKWKSENEIEKFMSFNQFEENAEELWIYEKHN